MTAITTIKCDHCGTNLTSIEGRPEYRLALQAEPIPMTGNHVKSIMVYPPINSTHHYCGTGCLSAWLDAQKGR
jgi:hypothetical protein